MAQAVISTQFKSIWVNWQVRSMKNSMGQTVHEATPSMPVEIGGWKDMPVVGEPVKQYDSEVRLYIHPMTVLK